MLCGAALAAGLGYACVYLPMVARARVAGKASDASLGWMKREYHLSNNQFEQVTKLHQEYQPKCVKMCERIDEANMKIQMLLSATNAVTPEIREALAQAASLRTECEAAMLQHFYQVSAVMPAEEGKKYLAWVQGETLMPGRMVPMHGRD